MSNPGADLWREVAETRQKTLDDRDQMLARYCQTIDIMRARITDLERSLDNYRTADTWFMPKLNDHNSREIARAELRGIDSVLAAMDQRQVDVVYLADLIQDYAGNLHIGEGRGWALSRATAMRIKAMLEDANG